MNRATLNVEFLFHTAKDKMYKILLAIVVTTTLSSVVQADVSNSTDYPGISRPQGAEIVQYEEQDSDYRFILGSLKKINGVLVREKEQNLNGRLYRITYKVPERFSAQDAFAYIDHQITQMGANVLFQCVSRACGSSNQWANKVFKYSRLYGFDQSQSFASYRLGDQYFSIYSVQRGNKQVYLRIEVLVTKASSIKGNLAQGLGVPFTATNEEVQALIEFLAENPSSNVWLIGHNHEDVSIQQQLERSNQSVQRVKLMLLEKGVDSTRIKLHSLGSFSPEGDTEISIYVE